MTIQAARPATTRDLEWAAGFLEGEGWFSGSLVRGNPVYQVGASQVNSEPLGKLKQFFGGRVDYITVKRPRQQNYFRWYTTGARARGIMMTLFPLLSEQRQNQVIKALGVA